MKVNNCGPSRQWSRVGGERKVTCNGQSRSYRSREEAEKSGLGLRLKSGLQRTRKAYEPSGQSPYNPVPIKEEGGTGKKSSIQGARKDFKEEPEATFGCGDQKGSLLSTPGKSRRRAAKGRTFPHHARRSLAVSKKV